MMTRSKLILLLAAVAALGATLPAWAGGPAGVGDPLCLVSNPGKGAAGVTGTVALGIQSSIDAPVPVDVTLRLDAKKAGEVVFVRREVELQVFGRTNHEVLCDILQDADVKGDIRFKLGLPANADFFITDRSISRDEPQSADQQIPGSIGPLGDPRASTMADVKFWAR